MKFRLWQLLLAVLLFSIVFSWAGPARNPALATVAACEIAGIGLLTTRKNLPNVLAAAMGCICGAVLFGPLFEATLFAIRDGNYYLDSVMPARRTGLLFGWLTAIVGIRIFRIFVASRVRQRGSAGFLLAAQRLDRVATGEARG
jgi:hypothetical protein